MLPKLGILAGGGALPRRLVEAARAEGREVFVVGFHGHTDPQTLDNIEHAITRLGAAGAAIKALKAAGVVDIVMAGHIRRPSLFELRPDWRAARFFARAGFAALGDDGLLRAVRAELEDEGFRLVGPQDVMKSLLTPAGLLTTKAPDGTAESDINRGIAVLAALAPLDVGQAVVVQQGLVLGIEAIEGTEQLIKRAGEVRREGQGGVLIKLSKAQQDNQLDLPTIGPDTIRQCRTAGLRGIAVEAGRSIMLDKAACVAAANDAGMFILAVELQA